MNFITNLKLGTRLGLGFAAVLVLLAGVAAAGLNGMSHEKAALDEIVNTNVYKMSLLQDMSESVHVNSRVIRTIVLLEDVAAMEVERKKITDARAAYDKAWDALNSSEASGKDKTIGGKIDTAKIEARTLNNKVLELALSNKDADVIKLLLKEVHDPQRFDLPRRSRVRGAARQRCVANARRVHRSTSFFEACMSTLASAIKFALLGVAAAFALAGVDAVTRERIEANAQRALLSRLIDSLSRGVPAALSKLFTLGWPLHRRAAEAIHCWQNA